VRLDDFLRRATWHRIMIGAALLTAIIGCAYLAWKGLSR
jgi:hypothetical protein